MSNSTKKITGKLTGKQVSGVDFKIMLQNPTLKFIKHRHFPLNFVKVLRTQFGWNKSNRLFLCF